MERAHPVTPWGRMLLTMGCLLCGVAEADTVSSVRAGGTTEPAARPWLPADAPVSAAPAAERRAASYSLGRVDRIDLDDPRAVLTFVLSRLPDEVQVLPTENYLYWRFHTPGRYIWGNFRLAPDARDHDLVHIGYYEFREDLTGPEEANVRYRLLGPEDGVRTKRLDDFQYEVSLDGRTVRCALNRLRQDPPRAFRLADDEVFVFRTHDESNVQFHLLFNTRLRNFMFVLNEDDGPLHAVRDVTDDLAIDLGTGFLFYKDAERQGRKILIGTYRRNTQQNNYFDGPADQLSDNFIQDVPLYRSYLNQAYPFTRGVIDEYGVYLHDTNSRVAVAPYYTYSSVAEMAAMVRTCLRHGDVAEMFACLIPGGLQGGSDEDQPPPATAMLPPFTGGLPALLAMSGLAGLEGNGSAEAFNDNLLNEDWEGPDPLGTGGWEATGLWHLAKAPAVECPPALPFRSPVTSAYYGIDAACNYAPNARNFGFLTSPAIANLPSNAYLEFWHRRRTEVDRLDHYDQSEVQISVDEGPWALLKEVNDQSDQWVRSGPISLESYAGHSIRLRFFFDTVDRLNNGFLGWMIDDIRIAVGPEIGGIGAVKGRHMAGVTWHLANVTFLPGPGAHVLPWSPVFPPGAQHAVGVTWHVVNASFTPQRAKHAAGITWHLAGITFIPGESKHAAGITWHIPNATFIPPGAKHNSGVTWHVAGQTFIPPDAKHAAGVTWHVPGGTFIPPGAKHNSGVTWHVAGQSFIPPGTKHAAGVTWHVPGGTFIPPGTKHNSGSTWHVAGQTFIPPGTKHAAGTTWHIPGASFVPPGSKHNSGVTWHVAGQSFIPPGTKHAAGVTWHIPGGSFIPPGSKHNSGSTWHVGGVSFIPPGTKHAAGTTWHIPGGTFIPPGTKHNTGSTWHVGGVSFIPPGTKHAAGVTWHVPGGTFIPPGAKHNSGVTWHVAGVSFIPKDSKHAAGVTWHIPGATFVPDDAIHNSGVTWHVAGQTFIPAGTKHAAGITWHIPGGSFIPPGAKHNSGVTWHVAGQTFIPRNAKHMAGITWHQPNASFLQFFAVNGDEQPVAAECATGDECPPVACHQAVCNEIDQQCDYVPAPGMPCDDGDPHTLADACDQFGTCLGTFAEGMPCDDGNPCTLEDRLGPGGVCVGQPAPKGMPCTSDNHCVALTGAACDGEGQCVGRVTVGANCDDGDAGTLNDRCMPDGSCHGSNVMPCDNQQVCDGEETLDPLTGCRPGQKPDCMDFCAGEFGACEEPLGCVSQEAPICDQANDPFEGECGPDGCVTLEIDCDDGNECTLDFVSDRGECIHQSAPEGQVCDDGSACTEGEFCSAGACGGGKRTECDSCHACDDETGACDVQICPVPGCRAPFADADGDGDVDHEDFGLWQRCFSGAEPKETPDPAVCGCFDRDRDGDIDQADLKAFAACARGPAVPSDPTCDAPPSN